MRRTMVALALGVGLTVSTLGSAATAPVALAQAADQFAVSGTATAREGNILTLVTSDLTGSVQPIRIDMSRLSAFSIELGGPVSMTVVPRAFDTYLALGLREEGTDVDRLDYGHAHFETLNDTVQARTDNNPEDDEALAKQGFNEPKEDDD